MAVSCVTDSEVATHGETMQPGFQDHYRNIGYLFAVLLLLTLAGFFPSYLAHAPRFAQVSRAAIVHFHAAAALAWWLLLIAQPFLMRQGRRDLHRILGWASLAALALFVFAAVAMSERQFEMALAAGQSREAALASFGQAYFDLAFLLLFYGVALANRRRPQVHIRFMIAAAVISMQPGLARLCIHLIGPPGPLLAVLAIYALFGGLIAYDRIRMRTPILGNPYLPILGLFVVDHALDIFGGRTAAWQRIAEGIVAHLF